MTIWQILFFWFYALAAGLGMFCTPTMFAIDLMSFGHIRIISMFTAAVTGFCFFMAMVGAIQWGRK